MKPTVRWIYMGWFLLSAYLEALTCLKKWWRFWMTDSLKSRFENVFYFSWSYYLLDVSGSDSSWSWVSSFSKLLVFYSLLGTHHHFRFLTLVPKEKLRKSWKHQWLSFAVVLEVQWVPAHRQWLSCHKSKGPQMLHRGLVTSRGQPKIYQRQCCHAESVPCISESISVSIISCLWVNLGIAGISVYWVPGVRGGTRNRKVLFLEVGVTLFGVVEINLMIRIRVYWHKK